MTLTCPVSSTVWSDIRLFPRVLNDITDWHRRISGDDIIGWSLGRLQTDWQTAQSLLCSHESVESGTVSKKFTRQGIFVHDSYCIKHDKASEANQIQKHTVTILIHLLFVSCGAQLQHFSSDSRLNFLARNAGINWGMKLNLINFSMICFLEESMTRTDIWARYSSFFAFWR